MRRMIAITLVALITALIFIDGTSNKSSLALAPTQAATPGTSCELSNVFKAASALKASGDSTKDLTALLDLARNIQDADNTCTAMTFTGSGNFSSDVFDFKPGAYRVTVNEPDLTEDNLVSVEMLAVTSGDNCLDQFMFQDTLKADKPSISASKKYQIFGGLKSCRVTMTVDASSDWTLSFTLLK